MCRHDGFIADIQGCDDLCFPKNHTFPPEAVVSTRCGMCIPSISGVQVAKDPVSAELLATEKNGASLIGVSFLTLTAAAIFAVIA